MSAILEAISSGVSAMPLSAMPQFPAQDRLGVFAATLAAAQEGPAQSGLSAGAAVAMGQLPAASIKGAASNVTLPALASPQPKKLLNNLSGVSLSYAAAASLAVVPVSTPITTGLATHGLVTPGLVTPGLAALPDPITAGSVLPRFIAAAVSATTNSATTNSSAATEPSNVPSCPGQMAGAGTGQETLAPQEQQVSDAASRTMAQKSALSAQGNGSQTIVLKTAPTEANFNLPAEPTTPAFETNDIVPSIVPSEVSTAVLDGAAQNTFLNASSSADRLTSGAIPNQSRGQSGAVLPTNTEAQPNANSATTDSAATNQLRSGGAMANGNAHLEWNGSQVRGLELSTEPIPQAAPTVEPTLVPTLLATATPNAGNAGVFGGDAASRLTLEPQSGVNTASAPDMPVFPSPSIETAIPAEIMQQLSSASSLLSASAAAASARVPLHSTAPITPLTALELRGAGQGTASPTANPNTTAASGAPAGSDLGAELPIASQTPFSVFFSAAGSGAESAAATFPRMILPSTGAATHMTSAGAGANSTGVNSGVNSKTSPGSLNFSQPASGLTNKNSVATSEVANPQAGLPTPHTIDGSMQSAQPSPAPAGGTQASAPAPTSSGGATPPPVQAIPVELMPKAATPSAPGAAPNGFPQPAQTPAAPVPGPVQLAQLIARVEQAEMRIGMNTAAFGSVELRASVHANDVGLLIGSEKGDLRTLLANEMPALANTLQQQNLRLTSVSYQQGFACSGNLSGTWVTNEWLWAVDISIHGRALREVAHLRRWNKSYSQLLSPLDSVCWASRVTIFSSLLARMKIP